MGWGGLIARQGSCKILALLSLPARLRPLSDTAPRVFK